MSKRLILIALTLLATLAIVFPIRGAVVGSKSQDAEIQQTEPLSGMSELLNYPGEVSIQTLEGPDREEVLQLLLSRPETGMLQAAMEAKGFVFDPATAEVIRVEILDPTGVLVTRVNGMTMATIANELSGALTAMVPTEGGEGFFQAHHTNLDPRLAEVPDPPIVVNGMPYFYITTFRWINGRIIHWHYWWFDSHHHPNWYYSHYYWYWRYYYWYDWPWPYWYWWVHGWYYWRYWYFWSTWFPY